MLCHGGAASATPTGAHYHHFRHSGSAYHVTLSALSEKASIKLYPKISLGINDDVNNLTHPAHTHFLDSSGPYEFPREANFKFITMPPKRIVVEPRSRRAPKGVIGSTYDALTSPENAAVVRSIAIFGVCLVSICSRMRGDSMEVC